FIGSWYQGIHRAPLKTWPQMLASTVQFSNNDQPPITPPIQASSLGPATEGTGIKPAPSDTQQRARPDSLTLTFHAEAVLVSEENRAE
ncbi:hypothetical protein PUR57_00595, partial [Streptomyces sp. JV176]|uniref:hypothetical protein n=1 Tax=Streptomyces sp. JV176 TaxID=858630 RepID=UPI002E78590E